MFGMFMGPTAPPHAAASALMMGAASMYATAPNGNGKRARTGAAVGADGRAGDQQLLQEGGTPPEGPAALAVYLASARSDGLTGKMLAAVWDPWEDLDIEAVMATDAYTVRRLKQEE